MMRTNLVALAVVSSLAAVPALAVDADLADRVEHGYADNNGVKIHYAALGEGPTVVMIHGFPDYWYSWRHQMEALSDHFRVVAIDQRGYNLSDQPEGVENYSMALLVSDVVAVIRALGVDKAVVVGHDWGGAVAWQVALNVPQVVDKLIILNLPHPNGISRELATNEEQKANSAYARRFQQEGAHEALTAEGLSGWVQDPEARERYVEAFSRSDFEAMLDYYKANYPRGPYEAAWEAIQADPGPKVQVPVLMFHGLEDRALNAKGLNDTWEWVEKDLTLVTVPGSGHFVQQDAAELVSATMEWWLLARQ